MLVVFLQAAQQRCLEIHGVKMVLAGACHPLELERLAAKFELKVLDPHLVQNVHPPTRVRALQLTTPTLLVDHDHHGFASLAGLLLHQRVPVLPPISFDRGLFHRFEPLLVYLSLKKDSLLEFVIIFGKNSD